MGKISNFQQGISNYEVFGIGYLTRSHFSLNIGYSLFDIRYSLWFEIYLDLQTIPAVSINESPKESLTLPEG